MKCERTTKQSGSAFWRGDFCVEVWMRKNQLCKNWGEDTQLEFVVSAAAFLFSVSEHRK